MYNFWSLDCASNCKAWIKISNPTAVHMLRRHIILLIAIRLSDGDVKPGGPLGVYRQE